MGASALEPTLWLKLQTQSLQGAEVLGLTPLAARSFKSLHFHTKRSQETASKLKVLGLLPSSSELDPPPQVASSTALHVSSLSKCRPTSTHLICPSPHPPLPPPRHLLLSSHRLLSISPPLPPSISDLGPKPLIPTISKDLIGPEPLVFR